MLKKPRDFIRSILHKPYHVFLICLAFLFINLTVDKTLIEIFQLSRDLVIVKNRIEDMRNKNAKIKENIKKSSDPNFIEKEAREKLDFTNEGELIFIFPDNI